MPGPSNVHVWSFLGHGVRAPAARSGHSFHFFCIVVFFVMFLGCLSTFSFNVPIFLYPEKN